jgi:hypothetical protein
MIKEQIDLEQRLTSKQKQFIRGTWTTILNLVITTSLYSQILMVPF